MEQEEKQQQQQQQGSRIEGDTIYPSSSQEARSSNQEKQELKQSNMSS